MNFISTSQGGLNVLEQSLSPHEGTTAERP